MARTKQPRKPARKPASRKPARRPARKPAARRGPRNPPRGFQRVIPYLLYENAPATIEYLCRCFGFREREVIPGPEGKIMHAELSYQGNVVMLATVVPEMGHAAPGTLPGRHALVVVYVDDVDAHHARARAAGAKVTSDPQDQFYGDRTYRAEDLEGVQWYFHTHTRDVSLEELMKHQP